MRNGEKTVVHRFTEENWEELVLRSPIPVFVDFRLPERPSFVIGSTDLLWLRQEWEGQALVGYLDVSRNLLLALRYPVVDLPTLSLFWGGRIVKSFVGPTRFRQDFRGYMGRLSPRVPWLQEMTWVTGKSGRA